MFAENCKVFITREREREICAEGAGKRKRENLLSASRKYYYTSGILHISVGTNSIRFPASRPAASRWIEREKENNTARFKSRVSEIFEFQ